GLNPEKDATGTENIAFHVAPPTFSGPADFSIPAPAKDGAISHPQEIASAGDKQISQAPEDKAHGTASTPKGAYYSQESMSLQYCWENEPEPTKLPYEFGYSTLDYGQKDEFDLDTLFDSPTFMPEAAWSVPQEAVTEITETEPLRECTKSGRLADDTTQPTTCSPTLAPTSTQSGEHKTKKIDKPLPQTWERASVTPVVVLNRQQDLRFPMLKTQPRAFESSNPAEAQAVIAKLEETLEQFSIEGHVVGIQRGPIVTRYELKMAAGIKVNRILALTDELAMALEALRVRIEAPIPGRSTVGIEIPNKERVKVLLGDILGDPGFREYGGALPLFLGRDSAGNLLVEDLTRMPHLLIAGATGSGKSVAINSFISSLILTKSPEEVRFLLIDPKLVELSAYNDIPHLLHPVITEPNKAILALNWAVEEMERRYEDLAELGARDIRSYNDKLRQQRHKIDLPTMPYIVVLIDELGDLMMVAGKEVESSIIRLAQKARAVGIHLILATQRPSVDVITALIKANCPARIALQVAQKTDSRTILDSNGAEQLLGQGDMLFRHPARAQLIRAQAPLIEDEEVESVVAWAQKLAKPVYITLEDPKGKLGELEDGDEELLAEAWQIIIESQKASASYLQRRMRIGYNKAARLIEAFEARGLVGPQIGSKPREIYGNAQSLSR
ncbi:MAG: DNA translocase FtsK, partial [Turneriella sp.]|nr:DNA translocase FtsK [Turneriella sp.]